MCEKAARSAGLPVAAAALVLLGPIAAVFLAAFPCAGYLLLRKSLSPKEPKTPDAAVTERTHRIAASRFVHPPPTIECY